MQVEQKIEIFHAFWPFYRMLNVYQTANFQNVSQSIIIRNIGLAIGFSALIGGFIVAISAIAWHSYECNFEFREMAPTLGIMITTIQFAISYAAISKRIQQVNMVISSLQQTIKARERIVFI